MIKVIIQISKIKEMAKAGNIVAAPPFKNKLKHKFGEKKVVTFFYSSINFV